ncbi:MAG: ribonuclease HI [Desulfatibacillaceae bacterium]
MKKKFYAVARGRNPGIYTKWFGVGGAHEQIDGYPGARYKGFASRDEAAAWMEALNSGTGGRAASKSGGTPRNGPGKTGTSPTRTSPDDGEVLAYTDGGCIRNPGPGGYGVVLVAPDSVEEISGGFRLTTNNRMELLACIVALERMPDGVRAELYSDSQYVVNGLTKGWARRWREKGWMRTADQPAKNADLWARLLELYEARDVKIRWVRGHAGNPLNERCDQLAGAAARGGDLASDTRFEEAVSRGEPFA